MLEGAFQIYNIIKAYSTSANSAPQSTSSRGPKSTKSTVFELLGYLNLWESVRNSLGLNDFFRLRKVMSNSG